MIKISDIMTITDQAKYKLHLACRNEDGIEPLNEFVNDYNKWVGWNEWTGAKKRWTRDFIFSLMRFYPKTDAWLFGGIFKVEGFHNGRYVLRNIREYEQFVGRLIISFHRYQGLRGSHYKLEGYFDQFTVLEILPTRYNGEAFTKLENINHDFYELEPIFTSERNDWKAALGSVKGVYVISDKTNGHLYIGSAYGDNNGIWARWLQYIQTGHGGNQELIRLIKDKSMKYARENFHFSLLETMAMSTPDDAVIEREKHWKKALLSKKYGYNKN